MNNINFDENTMKNIKNMVDNGNISEAISNISPEMIQNISKMFANQESTVQEQTQNQGQAQNQFSNQVNSSTENNQNSNNNFDLSGIDMNTIRRMSSVIGKMNNSKDDPRANLLNSLKPYLRDSKKGKLDNYMNLLNVSKIAEIMKENNKENNNNV